MITDEEAEEIREKLLEQLENLPEEQQEQAEVLKRQVKNASKEQLEQFVSQMQAMGIGKEGKGACIFCQIVGGKVETIKIYEDQDILAILDIYPAAIGHMIVMPREHFETIEEIPDNLLSKLFIFIKAIMPSFLKITKAKGFNILISQEEKAGQRVKHFYLNLIPRYDEDNINLTWSQLKVDKKELKILGENLRKEALRELESKLEYEKTKAEKRKKAEEESEVEKIMKHIKRRLP